MPSQNCSSSFQDKTIRIPWSHHWPRRELRLRTAQLGQELLLYSTIPIESFSLPLQIHAIYNAYICSAYLRSALNIGRSFPLVPNQTKEQKNLPPPNTKGTVIHKMQTVPSPSTYVRKSVCLSGCLLSLSMLQPCQSHHRLHTGISMMQYQTNNIIMLLNESRLR